MLVYTGTDRGEEASGEDGFTIFDMRRGRDTVLGAATDDSILGGGGADSLHGGGGNDVISGGFVGDWLYGGDGTDRLFGGLGDDWLWGDAGDDRLSGGLGFDSLFGGAGNDLLLAAAGGGALFGGDGNDRLFDGNGAGELVGGLGDDLLIGGAGNDQFFLNRRDAPPDGGTDTLYGGAGADEFIIDLTDRSGTARIGAGGGSDRVQVQGMTGDFMASAAVTLPDGTVITGAEVWYLFAAGAGAEVDWQTGAGDDWLVAGSVSGRLAAGAGNDRIAAGDRVVLLGEDGNDDLRAERDATIYGGAGDDALNTSPQGAGDGSRLYGGIGDDRLQSAYSLGDSMTGGAGADTFVLAVPNAWLGDDFALDTVTDFTRGADRIGLYLDLAVISGAKPQATGTDEVLLFDSATGILTHDANGSAAGGRTDLMLLPGVTALDAGDFVLTR